MSDKYLLHLKHLFVHESEIDVGFKGLPKRLLPQIHHKCSSTLYM